MNVKSYKKYISNVSVKKSISKCDKKFKTNWYFINFTCIKHAMDDLVNTGHDKMLNKRISKMDDYFS